MTLHEACEFLGLDPAESTEATVRTAYARLLRNHRPDKDPEGFQRLNNAREIVLAFLRGESSPFHPGEFATESAGEASSAARGDSPPPVPASALEQAVTEGDPERIAVELAQWRDAPPKQWSDLLLWVWHRGFADAVTDEIEENRLIQVLALDDLRLAGLWLDQLVERGDYPMLLRFGERLQERIKELDLAVVAPLITRTAYVCAFSNPRLTRALLDLVFPVLHGHPVLAVTEARAIAGNVLGHLPEALRLQWIRHLNETDENTALDAAAAQSLVQVSMTSLGTWRSFEILGSFGPTVLQEACAQAKIGRPGPTASPSPQAEEEEDKDWRKTWRRDGGERWSPDWASGCGGLLLNWRILLLLIIPLMRLISGLSHSPVDDAPLTYPDASVMARQPITTLPADLRPLYSLLQAQGCGQIIPIVSQLPPERQAEALRSLLMAYVNEPLLTTAQRVEAGAVARKLLRDEDARMIEMRIFGR